VNIFILSDNPVAAAHMQCDRHVVKMALETAQLLCSPFEPGVAPYRRTHFNHPCSVWARQSLANFTWLVTHGYALCHAYTDRYGKTHKSYAAVKWCDLNKHLLSFPARGMTPFAQAMPPEYKHDDPVTAYRAYYRGAKRRFATWRPPSREPDWWSDVDAGA
jgi:hypothetical protein